MKRTGTTKSMRGAVLIAALLVLPVLFVAASLLFGRYPLPVRDVLTAIIRPGSVPLATRVAVWQLRLPRATQPVETRRESENFLKNLLAKPTPLWYTTRERPDTKQQLHERREK